MRLKASFQCEICKKYFTRKHSLNVHIASIHEENKPYQCEICAKTFTEKSKLNRHVVSVHEKVKKNI